MCVFLLSMCEIYAGVWGRFAYTQAHVVASLNRGVRSASLSICKWKGTGVWYWLSVQNLSLNFLPAQSESASQKQSQAEGL